MQSSATLDDKTGAGESAHSAANAASSQADTTASMEPAEVSGGKANSAGESTMIDDEAVPSPS